MYGTHYNCANKGTVPGTMIPFVIKAKDTPGEQSMQATIQYITRRKSQNRNKPREGKDMTAYDERFVSSWANL